MLSKTYIDLKVLNYQAKRCIASEKDQFITLTHREPKSFEVLSKLPVYCKIEMPVSDAFDMFIGLPLFFSI